MYARTIEFLRSNWKLYLVYIFLVSFLNIALFSIPEEIYPVGFAIILLELYLFSNFLLESSRLIKNRSQYNSLRHLFKGDKKMFLELIILFIFVFAVIFVLCVPFVIISYTPLDAPFSNIYSNLASNIFFKMINLLVGAFSLCLLCCWISYMFYYRKSTWESIISGSKIALSVKSLFFLICIYAGIITAINEYIWVGFGDSILQICISAWVTPIGFLLVFSHFALSEASVHNHSLQSDTANSSVDFTY